MVAFALVACKAETSTSVEKTPGAQSSSVSVPGVSGDEAVVSKAPTSVPSVPTMGTKTVPSSRALDAPFVDSLPEDLSFSIGTASRGYLVNGVAMKEAHPCLKIRTSARNKKATYGTRDRRQP